MPMEPVGNSIGNPAPEDNMGNNMMPMGDGQEDGMNDFGGEQSKDSQFDTHFDAGVEADEDTDPKKFIQQLTGKLSTTLNSYNSENADDDGLNKYVAKMIVKASTKNMGEADKKDVIKAINTSQNPEPADDDDEKQPETKDVEGDEVQQEVGEPMQENIISKKQLKEMAKRRKNKK